MAEVDGNTDLGLEESIVRTRKWTAKIKINS